ncbi:MAG: hypothetical protein MJ211_10410 [Bacteroidales bacterium]|nr:hypothetical protein [Bacteroidales bacterium]
MEKKVTFWNFLFMMLAFAIYSSSGIFSKMASYYEFLSPMYIINIGGVILVLGIYAIMWQLILKKMPLTIAFMWKCVCSIWGLLFSYFIFNENITLNNILGIIIIIGGLLYLTWEK